MREIQVPAEAIVRIRDAAGHVVGAGFLTTNELVLTCAHVLGGAPPAAQVTVEFPLLPADARTTARVVGWHPIDESGGGDIAVLRLDAMPPSATPARLSSVPTRWGEQVRVFGFPPDLGSDHGVWVEAELRAATGAGWLQIESVPGRRRIGPGFSGSPVFAPAAGGVVGMLVAAELGTGTTTSYVITVETLLSAHPRIAAPDPSEVSPFRGLEPFYERHAELFRGRDSLSARLLAFATTRPIVVVAGASGSGKSSLVHAGLIPRARSRGMGVAVFRMLSGEHAAFALSRGVLPVLQPELTEQAVLAEAGLLAARLSETDGQTMPWLADRLLSHAGPAGLLIFVDQFEEGVAERRDEAQALFGLLQDLTAAAPRHRDGSSALVAVLTLRSGTLDDLVTDRIADSVAGGVVFVPPMTREQLAEAIAPAGVAFEPGLAGRILDDAGLEPGTLPLVEFAMAQLWDKRVAGTLTHTAYDEMGGVSGALAGHAERLYGQLSDAEQNAARRLLVSLARPEEGGFLRRSMRLSDVDDDLIPVLGKLSTGRLVVVGRPGGGEETVELAHQALLNRWPRLGAWLAEQRDFLLWREHLREGIARWQADNRDQGGLLRGAALVRAEGWLAHTTAELSTMEREYVHASRARERRRTRIARVTIAAISVLAVVAGGLAVLADRANRNAQEQLRIAHSRALADESIRSRQIDPRMALQLAQAAWSTAPTAEAYGALFTQYASLQHVDKVFQELWNGDVSRVMTSPDGSRTVFATDDGRKSIWDGLNGGNPSRAADMKLPHPFTGGTLRLSPSGRLLAYDNGAGTIAFWELGGHDPAETILLRDTTHRARVVRSMAFSPDETRLLIQRSGYDMEDPEFEQWDLARRRQIPVARRISPQDIDFASVFLGPGPNDVMLGRTDGAVDVYDLSTGEPVRSVPPPKSRHGRVALGGTVVVHCETLTESPVLSDTLRVIDVADGSLRRTIPVDACRRFELDTSTKYALINDGSLSADAANGRFTVVDLSDGSISRLNTPNVGMLRENIGIDKYASVAVYSDADGRGTVLIADGSLLYRLRLTDSGPKASQVTTGLKLNPQGDLGAKVSAGRTIELVDVTTGAVVATAQGGQMCLASCGRGSPIDFTPDGKRLLTVQEDTLVSYSVPGLTVEGRIDLPVPADIGGPSKKDGETFPEWGGNVDPLHDGQVAVLHAGLITRWDLRSGTQIGAPTRVRTDPDALRRSGHLAVLIARPRHPDQAAVIEPNGDVELWDLDQHRIVAKLGQATVFQSSIRFTADSSVVAVRTPGGHAQLWDADHARMLGRPIPIGGDNDLLGFTPDGKLIGISHGFNMEGAQIWDQHSGKLLAVLTSGPSTSTWRLEGYRLTHFGSDPIRSVQLDPRLWFDTLCGLSNRDFTSDERTVLAKLGTPEHRPCT